MAATVEASRLTEAHRLAQARLGAQVVRLVLAAWPLLDPVDLDRSVSRWLRVVLPLIERQRRTSATLAANYLATFRTLELGIDAETAGPVLADTIDRKAVTTSLIVTGPATVKANMARAVPLAKAVDIAQVRSSRAAMRHTLAGGRDTIAMSVAADRQALGWARATSGKACAFCAMLASRGPVYSEGTVDFQAHDGCACTAEPVYRRDAAWPAGAREARDLWDEVTGDARGAEKLAEFRRALGR